MKSFIIALAGAALVFGTSAVQAQSGSFTGGDSETAAPTATTTTSDASASDPSGNRVVVTINNGVPLTQQSPTYVAPAYTPAPEVHNHYITRRAGLGSSDRNYVARVASRKLIAANRYTDNAFAAALNQSKDYTNAAVAAERNDRIAGQSMGISGFWIAILAMLVATIALFVALGHRNSTVAVAPVVVPGRAPGSGAPRHATP